jgi:transketolase
MRAAIRIAALSELPTSYILTHDSVGVGEDGPTHQPVESTSALRIIPNLDVIRPADPEEVAGALMATADRKKGPTAVVLSRQNVRTLNEIPVASRRMGVLKGGYVALKETSPIKMIILATGSELQLAMDAARELGSAVRVVSMPCFERFDRQDAAYKMDVLPPSVTVRMAIEAGVSDIWYKYVGLAGKVIGTDRFGFSAPGCTVMDAFGINARNLVDVAQAMLKETVDVAPAMLKKTKGMDRVMSSISTQLSTSDEDSNGEDYEVFRCPELSTTGSFMSSASSAEEL